MSHEQVHISNGSTAEPQIVLPPPPISFDRRNVHAKHRVSDWRPVVEPRPRAIGRPRVNGKLLEVNGERLLIKGVTYGTFAPNDRGEPFPPFWQLRDDFAR